MIKKIFLLTACFFFTLPSFAQSKFTGEDWAKLTNLQRLIWVNGYVEGVTSADLVPVLTCDVGDSKKFLDCYNKGTEAISSALTGKFRNVSIDTLVDGVDVFYSDYKNRRVGYVGALNYVASAVAGKSAADLEKMAEDLRVGAAKARR